MKGILGTQPKLDVPESTYSSNEMKVSSSSSGSTSSHPSSSLRSRISEASELPEENEARDLPSDE